MSKIEKNLNEKGINFYTRNPEGTLL